MNTTPIITGRITCCKCSCGNRTLYRHEYDKNGKLQYICRDCREAALRKEERKRIKRKTTA